MKGWMYILECSDGSYYSGSTKNLELRLQQHQNGEGANHTKKHLPVKLVYFEEFQRIDEAFYREKQVQGWSRKKKEALINGEFEKLPELSKNYASTGSATWGSTGSATWGSTGSATDSTGSATGNHTVPVNHTVPEPVEGTSSHSKEVPEPSTDSNLKV
jgi:putative endonuclease